QVDRQDTAGVVPRIVITGHRAQSDAGKIDLVASTGRLDRAGEVAWIVEGQHPAVAQEHDGLGHRSGEFERSAYGNFEVTGSSDCGVDLERGREYDSVVGNRGMDGSHASKLPGIVDGQV